MCIVNLRRVVVIICSTRCGPPSPKTGTPNDTRDISRHLVSEDLQRIEDELAKLFRESSAHELDKGGHALVDAPKEDTLRVTPAIINIYIDTPHTMPAGRSRTHATEARTAECAR